MLLVKLTQLEAERIQREEAEERVAAAERRAYETLEQARK